MALQVSVGHFLFQNVPTFCENDVVFSEYAYTRYLASQIQERLLALNLDARLLVHIIWHFAFFIVTWPP